MITCKGRIRVEILNRMTIKDLPAEERPYEKLEANGGEVLSNAELLAIIIKTGTRKERSIEIAQRLLSMSQSLSGLYRLTINELKSISGIGRVKAVQIKAVLELSKRIAKTSAFRKLKITSPKSIANIYMEDMRYLDREHFRVVFLDTKNHILSDSILSVGTVNASLVDPREIFMEALRKTAVHMILMHNHPSGDPTPSKEDIEVTKRICEAGELMGIDVIDHIIIGDGQFTSLKELGFC